MTVPRACGRLRGSAQLTAGRGSAKRTKYFSGATLGDTRPQIIQDETNEIPVQQISRGTRRLPNKHACIKAWHSGRDSAGQYLFI